MVARFAGLAAEVQRSSPTTKIVYMTGYAEEAFKYYVEPY